MKVICVDNFNRDHVDDKLICDGCVDFWAVKIANLLNMASDPSGPDWFKAVPDDYKLNKFEP